MRMTGRVQVRELRNDEGRKLLAIVRRRSGSIVRWRTARIVLWYVQQMSVQQTAEIAVTSQDRVREVIHNFNTNGSRRWTRSAAAAGRPSSPCPSGRRHQPQRRLPNQHPTHGAAPLPRRSRRGETRILRHGRDRTQTGQRSDRRSALRRVSAPACGTATATPNAAPERHHSSVITLM